MAMDSYREASSKDGEGKKKLHHLRIHPHKGGHLVTHHAHHPMGGHEEQPYQSNVFSSDQGESLLAHISKHAKVKGASPESGSGENPYEEEPEEVSATAERTKHEPKRAAAEEKGAD